MCILFWYLHSTLIPFYFKGGSLKICKLSPSTLQSNNQRLCFFSQSPLGIVLHGDLHVVVLVSDPTSSEVFRQHLLTPLHSSSGDTGISQASERSSFEGTLYCNALTCFMALIQEKNREVKCATKIEGRSFILKKISSQHSDRQKKKSI